ncbi:hypothetical protein [Novosphingobium mathurense]|uniref:Uncharacterized protein n=1 Tax=Novosphingobium mathurense TaxID=428990 RepID=A0A1U6IL05_9SPHN|nr:hypothetical protein [Novosphingobium mathurense]SLK08725.1 hypothetical protein SAMN06295987_108106 [Novosphingobium mathurense]
MSSPPPLSEDSLVQMRVAHLSMIQGVISRLSGFSANAKNFCITVMAALVAVAFQKPVPELIWAGVAVPALFALLDAYYLAQEKRFRFLYETASAAPVAMAEDMSLKAQSLDARRLSRAVFSLSVGGFYLALLVGMLLLLYIASHGPEPKLSGGDRANSGRTAVATAKPSPVAGRSTAQPAAAPKQSTPAGEPTGALAQ